VDQRFGWRSVARDLEEEGGLASEEAGLGAWGAGGAEEADGEVRNSVVWGRVRIDDCS